MTIQEIATLLASLATVAGTIFVALQVRQMNESISLARLQSQHALCLEIWKQYNDVFSERQQLLQNPIRLAEIVSRCPTIEDIVTSEDYLRLKRVAGVYVLAGALVESGAIAPDVIFQYISVPRRMWNDHQPLVRYLRDHYYPNLWDHWERLVTHAENTWTTTGLRVTGKREAMSPRHR